MTRRTLQQAVENAPIERRSPAAVLQLADEGPSPRGSTYFKMLMACSYEFALWQLVGMRPKVVSKPLSDGLLWHEMLAVYYRAQIDDMGPDGRRVGMDAAYELLEQFREEPGYKETYETLHRMFSTYLQTYDGEDRWRVIAVEETLAYECNGVEYSARFDLLIEDLARGGMYNVEHKSARSVTNSLIDSYQLDIQILGQQWLMLNCLDLAKYPTYKGVIVNIATKQARTVCHRVECYPSPRHTQMFEDNLVALHRQRENARALGWPRSLGHCSGFARGYGKCQFYDVCHAWPEMRIEDWEHAEPPIGYIKESR